MENGQLQSDPDNIMTSGYKPIISIIITRPVVTEVIEKHVKEMILLLDYLIKYAPTSPRKWGICGKLVKINDICINRRLVMSSRERKELVCMIVVFLGVSKTFDNVPHLPFPQQSDLMQH